MLSSDKNIETIARLIEALKDYMGLRVEGVKLGAIEKLVRLITALIIFMVFAVVVVFIVLFLSLAAAHALSSLTGPTLAYVLVAALYVVAFLCLLAKREAWIERPMVRFLTEVLADGE